MKKALLILLAVVSFHSCSMVSILLPHERVGGVEIVSVEDIESADGLVQREIRGIVAAPLETDEDWYVAFQSIYAQKKVPGKNTIIKIYLEEENWELGTPYAVGKFLEDKRATMKVDDRLIKVQKP